ncbi:MAG TPA: phosphoglycerate mutase family protein [Cyclobacteriaceae bacterium]|nr:phosphoglycerate mutase family protein [Cyclobacteriaceae bacterium]
MKKLVIIICVAISTISFAQEKTITTFILVRHAEKDLTQSTNDPDLSIEGKSRATRLSELFKKADIAAVYSTPFKRTQQTVAPLALQHSLNVVSYQAMVKEDVDLMLQKHGGQTVVVSGHSNTIPNLINYLIGEDKYKNFSDEDYGNIVIVSVTERGKNAKVVWMRY